MQRFPQNNNLQHHQGTCWTVIRFPPVIRHCLAAQRLEQHIARQYQGVRWHSPCYPGYREQCFYQKEAERSLMNNNLKEFLDKKVDEYNRPFFIQDDPVSIPHQFSKKQDI